MRRPGCKRPRPASARRGLGSDSPRRGATPPPAGNRLLQVAGEMLVHFEHAYLVLAAEDGLQLGVGQDVALVLRVLQVVLLDVVPNLGNHFTPGKLSRPDDGGQLRRRRQWLLQGVGLLGVSHLWAP